MKKKFALLSILFVFNFIYSQENQGIPPSPTVASLVTIEKDSLNNTGTIVQNISLTNLNLGSYSFPINLIYSSNGIKVEEIPSYVGTGWNLSAGGVITRSVMDLPDDLMNNDHGNGILHTDMMNKIFDIENQDKTSSLTNQEKQDFFKNEVNESLTDGTRNDTQPDIFYFSFFGINGKFIFNKDKEIVSLNNDNFKYSYTMINNTLESFTIIDSQGVQYVFSEREFSETEFKGGVGWYFITPRSTRQRHLDYYSSWHLKRILTPNNYSVVFDYDNETIKYEIRGAVMSKICDTGQCEDAGITNTDHIDILNDTKGAMTEYIISTKKLKRIVSENFTIDFKNTTREDLEGGLKLSEIIIKNSKVEIVNNYKFEYSYFISQGTSDSNIYENKRLKLEKIYKNNDYLNEFLYYDDFPLPNRKSKEQDFWGFYNNNGANSLIPKVYAEFNQQPYSFHIFQPIYTPQTYTSFGIIDRNVNQNYVHQGMLKSIEYKTGGKKTFFYDPNDFMHSSYTTPSSSAIKGNGVRLKKIEYFDGNHTETINYNYNSPITGKSSGRVSYLPSFALHIPWEFTINGNNVNWSVKFPGSFIFYSYINYVDVSTNPPTNGKCYWNSGNGSLNLSPINNPSTYFGMTTRRYSTTQIPLSSNIQNPFSYEYITITEENNGSKEFNFNILGALDEPISQNIQNLFTKRNVNETYYFYLNDPTFQESNQGGCQFLVGLGNSYLQYISNMTQYFDFSGNTHPLSPSPNWNQYFGTINSYTYKNENGYKVYKQENIYDIVGDINNTSDLKKIIGLNYTLFIRPYGFGWGNNSYPDTAPSTSPAKYIWSFYDIYYGNGLVLKQSKKTLYYENESKSLTNIVDYDFRSGNFVDRSETTLSDGSSVITKYKYPIDFAIGGNVYEQMVNKNMLYTPIETINIKNGNKVTAEVTAYQETVNGIYPAKKSILHKLISSTYNGAAATSNGLVLHNDFEDQIFYDTFDDRGNLIEYHNKANINSLILWGYNREYPIAKLENITYSEADNIYYSQTNKNLNNLSTSSRFNQQTFRNDLNDFKDAIHSQKPEVNISSYTFNPMIGVTSISDSRSNTVYFNYDSFNRLKNSKDLDGNIVQDFKYNYKNKDLLQNNNPLIVPSFSVVAVPNSYSSPILPDTSPNSICFNGTVFSNAIQLSTSNPQIGSQILIDEINATPSHLQNQWGSSYSAGIRWVRFYGQNESIIWDVNPSTGVITGISSYTCN